MRGGWAAALVVTCTVAAWPAVVAATGVAVPLRFRAGPPSARWAADHPQFFTQQRAGTASVPLGGGIPSIGMYYTRVLLGGQEVHVQVDTGSSTLAAPLKVCKHCRRDDRRYNLEMSEKGEVVACESSMCNGGCGYGCSSCSSSNGCCSASYKGGCHFKLSYADGSGASGALVRDELDWGGIKVNVTFGGIAEETKDFERPRVDGILGIGHSQQGCHPVCFPSAFAKMVSEGLVDDIFTICISLEGGQMLLGGIDESAMAEKITYVPAVESSAYWTARLTNKVTVGDDTFQFSKFPTQAVVDSGTTLLGLPRTAFDELRQYYQKHYCNIPGLCNGAGTWFKPGSCSAMKTEHVQALPTLKFYLQGGMTLVLPPDVYMIPYKDNGRDYMCLGLMITSMANEIVVGNTVMRRYVTVYDRVKSRIGFALSKPDCGAQTRDKSSDTDYSLATNVPAAELHNDR